MIFVGFEAEQISGDNRVCPIGTNNQWSGKTTMTGFYPNFIGFVLDGINLMLFVERNIGNPLHMLYEHVVKINSGANISISFFAVIHKWDVNVISIRCEYLNTIG